MRSNIPSQISIENILNTIYDIIEKILPILVPFIGFILPIIIVVGSYLRSFIGTNLFPYFPLYPETGNYIPWIIISGLIMMLALVLIFLKPERTNDKK